MGEVELNNQRGSSHRLGRTRSTLRMHATTTEVQQRSPTCTTRLPGGAARHWLIDVEERCFFNMDERGKNHKELMAQLPNRVFDDVSLNFTHTQANESDFTRRG